MIARMYEDVRGMRFICLGSTVALAQKGSVVTEGFGNCLFCIHKKWSKLALVARDMPEKAKEFITCVQDNPRDKGKGNKEGMYQNQHDLSTVIAMFKDIDRDTLHELMIKGKRTETGSCSESCEPLM